MNKKNVFLLPILLLMGCSDNTTTIITYVTNYQISPNVYYTGNVNTLLKPNGNGLLKYDDGKTFAGVFDNGNVNEGIISYSDDSYFSGFVSMDDNYLVSRSEGRYSYKNGQYYEGRFKNDLYDDDDGFFSYHLTNYDGSTYYTYQYQGGFKNGLVDNQIGTIYYPALFNNSYGMLYATGVMKSELQLKLNQNIVGKYRYPNSPDYYEGEGFYNGESLIPLGKGKTIFGSGCIYEGEYFDGKYDGTGMFYWPNKSYYQGEFNNGTPDGCIGTYHYANEANMLAGIWNFTGLMQGFVSPANNTNGTGEIHFSDGYKDWYNGEISIINNAPIRNGIGTERWSNGSQSTSEAGLTWAWQNASEAFKNRMSELNLCQDKITAVYDKNYSGGWINGDGYWYIQTMNGIPYGYVSGTWEGSVVRKGNISPDSELDIDPLYLGTLDLTSLWEGVI